LSSLFLIYFLGVPVTELGSKIKAVCEANRITYEQLAVRLGVSSANVNSYLHRKIKEPSAKMMIGLAELAPTIEAGLYFLGLIGLSQEKMRSWLPDASKPPARTLIETPEIRVITAKEWEHLRGAGDEEISYDAIPLFRSPVAAGTPREVDEKDVEGWALIHRSLMKGHRPGNVVCVRVKGNSMEPVLPDHGLAAVDISMRQITWSGARMALVGFEGDVTVKLVKKLPKTMVEISAYNNDAWEPQERSNSQVDILGTVVWWWGRAK
jgi:transcriptional regulator with XRE-family HTH domain